MQGQALNMLGSIQKTFGNIKGGDQLQSMLGIDLKAEIPTFDLETNKKKKDGKKNNKRKKV